MMKLKDIFNFLTGQTGRDETLLLAVERSDVAGVRNALAKGASPDAGTGESFGHALTRAAATGSLAIVKLLVEAGAKIDAQNYTGRTALHESIWHLKSPVALYLLEQGAKTDTRDRPGKTPLQDAIDNELKPLALALIDKGADTDALDDKKNDTMRALIERRGWMDVAQAIDDRNARLRHEAEQAAIALEQERAAFERAISEVGTLKAPVVAGRTASFAKHRQSL
jgi:ankyrin repeat protein